MTSSEFLDVAAQVLRAHVMIGAVVSALEHRPERLDAVGMGLIADVLADGVLDGLMLEGQAVVALVVVGVNGRPGKRCGHDKAL